MACIERASSSRRLNCYVTETAEEQALAAADASDARRCAGNALGALDGVPVAVKLDLSKGKASTWRNATATAKIIFRSATGCLL